MKSSYKIFLGCLLIICYVFTSACKVTWASFTTPKKNIQNVTQALDFLKISNPNNCRILEFDDKNYIGFFAVKTGMLEKLNQNIQKTNDFTLMVTTKKSKANTERGKIENLQSGKWHITKYIPQPNEPQIITANYLMQAINDLKKNKKFEIYSQTDDLLQRIFIIIYR